MIKEFGLDMIKSTVNSDLSNPAKVCIIQFIALAGLSADGFVHIWAAIN